MARLLWCMLALLAAGGLTESVKTTPHKAAGPDFVQRQLDLIHLFFGLHEPKHIEISKNWSLKKDIQNFANVTAVTTLIELLEHDWVLPKSVPFNIHESAHKYEAVTLFNVLYSAKDYDTFYKTAIYARKHFNEYIFSYVLTIAIYNRKETVGIFVPHIYEVFPSFFYNGEILTTAQRINIHGFHNIEYYPSTYKKDNNVVINLNTTFWPFGYYNKDAAPLAYFTHDHELNAYYYNLHVAEPNWLGGKTVSFGKDRRGEWFWFIHKQLLSRYYMERLSNGLREISDLSHEVVEEGYSSGLLYHNGIPYRLRPNYFHLDQPDYIDEIRKIYDCERRIRDAIDQGYFINHVGEPINIYKSETIENLGRIIEANADSPNTHYYKNFISPWKKVLGNSFTREQSYHHFIPLVVPSTLEHYQTALRDTTFYMIWKRVLNLFKLWHEHLPQYKREELDLPQVAIQKVDVDKLVTYFEHSYVNISNHLYTTLNAAKDKVTILVQRPVLQHKVFQVRINVKSEVAKSVVVKFFLGPKYDSDGQEIPLHINSENFYQFDEFIYDLPAGESVITRNSNDNNYLGKKWSSTYEVIENAQKSLQGKGQFFIDQIENLIKFPRRLVLPKGRVGGMPFVLMVYISEYRAPAVPYGTGFDPTTSFGTSSGARFITDEPLGFPVNRPLHSWQVEGLHNLIFKDVLIHHKHTPEAVFFRP